MPAPNDINSQIALKKGWAWHEEGEAVTYQVGIMWADDVAHWQDPTGKWAIGVPDFTGTVEAVDGMMRELNETRAETAAPYYNWSLRWSALFQIWDFYGEDEVTDERRVQFQSTKEEGSGVAVGRAWLSVFGKEADDAL